MGVSRGWREWGMRLLFNRDGVSVLQDEKTYGAGWWGWLHNITNGFNTTEWHTAND